VAKKIDKDTKVRDYYAQSLRLEAMLWRSDGASAPRTTEPVTVCQ
jgi:hypothetical protein